MVSRLFSLTALAVLVAACSQSTPERPASTPTEVATQRQKAAQEFCLDYSPPVSLDSLSTYQYQIIGLLGKESRSSSRLKSYDGSSSDYRGSNNFNIVFFQPDGTDAHLLLPHSRFRISEFDTRRQPQARVPYLFYDIITTDFNHDGRQDADDPTALFASDRQGLHLRQITPDSTDMLSWQVMAPHYLVVQLRQDTDHDARFGSADAVQWLRYDLRNLQASPTTLLPAPLLQTLHRQLIDRRLQLPNED